MWLYLKVGPLGSNEVISVGPWSHRISVLKRGDPRELSLYPCFVTGMQWEGSYLKTRKRAPTRNHLYWHPDLLTFSLKNCEKIDVYCVSRGWWWFLWQPEQTGTEGSAPASFPESVIRARCLSSTPCSCWILSSEPHIILWLWSLWSSILLYELQEGRLSLSLVFASNSQHMIVHFNVERGTGQKWCFAGWAF